MLYLYYPNYSHLMLDFSYLAFNLSPSASPLLDASVPCTFDLEFVVQHSWNIRQSSTSLTEEDADTFTRRSILEGFLPYPLVGLKSCALVGLESTKGVFSVELSIVFQAISKSLGAAKQVTPTSLVFEKAIQALIEKCETLRPLQNYSHVFTRKNTVQLFKDLDD